MEFGGGNHHFVHPCTNPDAVATGALCSAFIPLYVSRPLWLLIRDRPVYVVNVIEVGCLENSFNFFYYQAGCRAAHVLQKVKG